MIPAVISGKLYPFQACISRKYWTVWGTFSENREEKNKGRAKVRNVTYLRKLLQYPLIVWNYWKEILKLLNVLDNSCKMCKNLEEWINQSPLIFRKSESSKRRIAFTVIPNPSFQLKKTLQWVVRKTPVSWDLVNNSNVARDHGELAIAWLAAWVSWLQCFTSLWQLWVWVRMLLTAVYGVDSLNLSLELLVTWGTARSRVFIWGGSNQLSKIGTPALATRLIMWATHPWIWVLWSKKGITPWRWEPRVLLFETLLTVMQ